MANIQAILDSILGQHDKQGIGELYYYCPFCHHHNPKLAINILKRKWQCWKCGARGSSLLSLLRKLNVPREQIQQLKGYLADELPTLSAVDESPIILQLPEEFKPLYIPDTSLAFHHAMGYIKSRGITDIDIMRYNIGYCSEGMYRNRIIIPSYGVSGILNYFVGRAFFEGQLNYITPKISKNLIGLEDQINWKYPIVIVEGIFDAIAVRRNAVPLFGKQLPRKLRQRILEEGVRSIYLALDNDALKDTVIHAEKLMKEGIDVYVVELSGKDPSTLGFIETQKLIKAATKLSFVELMKLKLRLS